MKTKKPAQKIFKVLVITFFIFSCSLPTEKKTVSNVGNILNQSITNFDQEEVQDYNNNYKVYNIRVNHVDKNMVVVEVSPQNNFYKVDTSVVIGKKPREFFPTSFLHLNGRLFVWHDEKSVLTKSLIDTLDEYKVLDSTYFKAFTKKSISPLSVREFIIDEKRESVYYFFCKNNSNNFIKKRTNMHLNQESYPKVDCKTHSNK